MFWGHGIIAVSAPRMTAEYSFQREPAAFYQAMGFKRLKRIMRTRGCVPAVFSQPRRYAVLIKTDHYYKRKYEDFIQHYHLSATKIKEKLQHKLKLTNNNILQAILMIFIYLVLIIF